MATTKSESTPMETSARNPKTAVRTPADVTRSTAETYASFAALMKQKTIPTRLRADLWRRLHYLLHVVSVCTPHLIEDVTAEEIERIWLAPARGLWEWDVRVELLGLLQEIVPNPGLRSVVPSTGSKWLRRVRRVVFWRSYQSEVHGRTRDFFGGITQEDVTRVEAEATPYYLGLGQFQTNDEDAELDNDVVAKLREAGLEARGPISVTDLGCARGRLLDRIRQEWPASTLTGVDFLDIFTERLDKLGVHFIKSHVGRTPLPDASQDVVVSTNVIEHLRRPEEMVLEIRRILKPGGVFCVVAPCSNASFFSPNPLTYFLVGLGSTVEGILPPFHNLYAPLTPLKVVHHEFSVHEFRRLFLPQFPECKVGTAMFIALRKFSLDHVARDLPLLKMMGTHCIAWGMKN